MIEFGFNDEYDGVDPRILQIMEVAHQQAHNADHDVQDTLFVQLTLRETWLLALAMLLLSQSSPCLAEDCGEFTGRLIELIDTQKGADWSVELDGS